MIKKEKTNKGTFGDIILCTAMLLMMALGIIELRQNLQVLDSVIKIIILAGSFRRVHKARNNYRRQSLPTNMSRYSL